MVGIAAQHKAGVDRPVQPPVIIVRLSAKSSDTAPLIARENRTLTRAG